MKRLKRIMALVIAMAMVLGLMSMSAFADTNNLVNDAKLTVTGLDEGDNVKYYQVIKWNQNTGWGFTDQFAGLAELSIADIKTDSETVDSRIDSVLKYIIGVNAESTIDQNGVATADLSKPAIEGKINSKLAGIIAKMANTPIVADGEIVGSEGKWEKTIDQTPAAAGLYTVLVAAKNSGVVYNPIFVASDYYNPEEDGVPAQNASATWPVVNLLPDGSNAAAANSYSDSAMAKKTTIEVNKKVADTDGTTPDTWVDGELTGIEKNNDGNYSEDAASTSKVGDIVTFTVDTIIPLYAGNYSTDSKQLTFNIYDTMSTGLELVDNSVEVKTGATAGSETALSPTTDSRVNYSLTTVKTGNGSDKNVSVVFTDAYLKSLTTPQHVVVTYKAKITDTAATNVNNENNTVQVEYSNNPTDANSVGVLKDVAEHYTFSLDASALGVEGYENSELVKVGVDKDGNEIQNLKKTGYSNGTEHSALEGAKFGLYTDTGCTTLFTSGIYTSSEPDNANAAVLSTDGNGKLNFKGLDVGTYYLKEVSAPNGYIKSDIVYKIEIKGTFEEREVKETVSTPLTDGKTTNEEVTYKTKVLTSYTVKVVNLKADGTEENDGTTSTYTVSHGTDQPVSGEDYYANTGITVDHTSTATGETAATGSDQSHKLINTQGTPLPATGGIGTTIFYTIGAILVIGAGVILITRRRMDA
jgi:LPXTG-motif cell wall-anchored protein